MVQELKQELSLYRENLREQVLMIQENTRKACERDFELREGQAYQEQLKREAELHEEIEERDNTYKDTRTTIEKLKLRNAFDKLQLIRVVHRLKQKNEADADDYREQDRELKEKLDAVLGFLKGKSRTLKQEEERVYEQRIQELNSNNTDLVDQMRNLDYKNTTIED